MKKYFYILIFFIMNGCATLLNPDKAQVFIDSKPMGAEIFVNDNVTNKTTPSTLILDHKQDYEITLKKECFDDATIILEKKISMSGVIGDIFLTPFMAGLAVDAITGELRVLPSYSEHKITMTNNCEDLEEVDTNH